MTARLRCIFMSDTLFGNYSSTSREWPFFERPHFTNQLHISMFNIPLMRDHPQIRTNCCCILRGRSWEFMSRRRKKREMIHHDRLQLKESSLLYYMIHTTKNDRAEIQCPSCIWDFQIWGQLTLINLEANQKKILQKCGKFVPHVPRLRNICQLAHSCHLDKALFHSALQK